MNSGTIIRTILVIATCFNTALMATDVAQFGNEKINLIYKVLSVIANFVIVFCATYFNNDYSEEACIGTGVTRQLKAEKMADYYGDFFFDGVEDLNEDEEVEEEETDEVEYKSFIKEVIDEYF